MTVGAEPSKTSPPMWQSTIFGGALLRRETIKSLQWLFTSFKSWPDAGNSDAYHSHCLFRVTTLQYSIFDSYHYLPIKFDHNTCLPRLVHLTTTHGCHGT